ncbi:MAG: hypothetical protein AB7T37_00730 [Dehalococcoidia bacterium]
MLELQRTLGNRAVVRELDRQAAAAGSVPRGAAIQRSLAIDGQAVAAADSLPADVETALAASGVPPEICKTIVHEAVIDPGFGHNLSAGELVVVVKDVYRGLQNVWAGAPSGVTPGSAGRLVKRVNEGIVGGQLTLPGRGNAHFKVQQSLPESQSAALAGFLNMHPDFKNQLKGVKFKFGSEAFEVKNLGGLFTRDNTVHIEPQDDPEAFMKLLLHELGHATFQKMLLEDPSAALGEAAAKDTPAGPEEALQSVDKVLEQRTKPLNDDGKKLYDAWRALKAAGATSLFAVRIGERGEQDRREYQAANFNEFCAETFMHVARDQDAWLAHIGAIVGDADMPNAIKDAWKAVRDILAKYAESILGTKLLEQVIQ